MDLIDSHAHLTSSEVAPHLPEILQRAKAAGVSKIINICTDPITLERGILERARTPWIYNAGSTTPHDAAKEGESCFAVFAKAAESGQLIAIGETGLDYHYHHSPKEDQRKWLIQYLHLAVKCSLPLIFHCRDAFEDLFKIVDQVLPRGFKVILHCFTGTAEEAKGCVERGWMVSVSGIATFKKSKGLREAICTVPLKHLLIETDTPYLAPQSKRGKSNEPSFLSETAACVARLKGVPLDEIAGVTTENAEKVFDFSCP